MAASTANRVRRWGGMALLHERELGEPDRVIPRPGPDERRVARGRIRAYLQVVLRVGLERHAAEQREAREVCRQPAPGHVFTSGDVGLLRPAVDRAGHVILARQGV